MQAGEVTVYAEGVRDAVQGHKEEELLNDWKD